MDEIYDVNALRERFPDLVKDIEREAVEKFLDDQRIELTKLTFYRTYWEATRALPKASQLQFLMGILDYAFLGVEPKLDKKTEAVFIGIRPNIDNSIQSAISGKIGGGMGGRPSKAKPVDPETKAQIAEVIEYLNAKADKHFRPQTAANARYIQARLNEGFGVDELKRAVDNVVSLWKGNAKMEQYLRPSTLFGPKFESYLNATTDDGGDSFGEYR